MSGYLVDTDTASYVIRRRPETLLGTFERHAHELAVSVITAAELRYGAAKSGRSGVSDLVEGFLSRLAILDWGLPETVHYARLRVALEKKGTPIGAMDLLIASHAASKDMTLVTNNVKHFDKVPGLRLEVWV